MSSDNDDSIDSLIMLRNALREERSKRSSKSDVSFLQMLSYSQKQKTETQNNEIVENYEEKIKPVSYLDTLNKISPSNIIEVKGNSGQDMSELTYLDALKKVTICQLTEIECGEKEEVDKQEASIKSQTNKILPQSKSRLSLVFKIISVMFISYIYVCNMELVVIDPIQQYEHACETYKAIWKNAFHFNENSFKNTNSHEADSVILSTDTEPYSLSMFDSVISSEETDPIIKKPTTINVSTTPLDSSNAFLSFNFNSTVIENLKPDDYNKSFSVAMINTMKDDIKVMSESSWVSKQHRRRRHLDLDLSPLKRITEFDQEVRNITIASLYYLKYILKK